MQQIILHMKMSDILLEHLIAPPLVHIAGSIGHTLVGMIMVLRKNNI